MLPEGIVKSRVNGPTILELMRSANVGAAYRFSPTKK